MDYQKKKVLTQSVAFMQANLTLTSEFLGALKNGGVLTGEEISTIQKDETTSGKVLELLCLLKRKDNRTFTRFLQVLEEQPGCEDVHDLLKSKGTLTEKAKADPRTIHFLDNFLRGVPLDSRMKHDIACRLVLKEIHHDIVTELQDQVAALQRQFKSKNTLRSDSTTYMSGLDSRSPTISTPTSNSNGEVNHSGHSRESSPQEELSRAGSAPNWEGLPVGQLQDLQNLLHQKDDILKRREKEYQKLRSVVQETQSELQTTCDLNSQYLNIISQMSAMHMSSAVTPRVIEKDNLMLSLESQLEEKQRQVYELQEEMESLSEELTSKEKELKKVLGRERRYKAMLGLPEQASEAEIEQKILELLEDGTKSQIELDKIRKELMRIKDNRGVLEERLTTINREKDKVEFHMRQQELTMKKMKRMRAAGPAVQQAENMLAAHGFDRSSKPISLPAIERPQSQIGLAKTQAAAGRSQYCVFCRSEYMHQVQRPQHCRIHFRPIRNAKWACCKDDSHRSAGCLQVPHFYIEITPDKKIFLTDGGRYLELT